MAKLTVLITTDVFNIHVTLAILFVSPEKADFLRQCHGRPLFLLWPRQDLPGPRSWAVWRQFIKPYTRASTTDRLRQPLVGPWTRTELRIWSAFGILRCFIAKALSDGTSASNCIARYLLAVLSSRVTVLAPILCRADYCCIFPRFKPSARRGSSDGASRNKHTHSMLATGHTD
jgi:hypothetical protein